MFVTELILQVKSKKFYSWIEHSDRLKICRVILSFFACMLHLKAFKYMYYYEERKQ